MTRARALAVSLVALMLVSLAAPAIAAPQDNTSANGINTDSDAVPDVRIDADVTKNSHEVGWDATAYENDNGDTANLNASLNDTDNPVSWTATDIEVDDFGAFPHDEANVSALEAGEWTTDASTGGSITVEDSETAPNVDAVSISTSSQTSGDTVTASMSNSSIGTFVDSDANKRYLSIAADVNSLDSSATVEVQVADDDGDYKSVYVDSANSTSAADTIGNSTGEGQVLQQQLGTLPTSTAGDGSFDSIDQVDVVVHDGNADVDISMLNTERLSPYNFGDRVNADGDTATIEEPNGEVSMVGVDSMGSVFDDAIVHDATYDMVFSTDELTDASDVHWNVTEAPAHPGFEHRADVYFRLSLPAAYDLSYSNAELTGSQDLPTDRYQGVELSEGVGDTAFENVSSWSDETSTFSTTGDHSLDDTVQVDTEYGLHFDLLWTAGNEDSAFSSAGGAGQFAGSGDGGIVDFIFGIPGVLIGGVLTALGIRKKRG